MTGHSDVSSLQSSRAVEYPSGFLPEAAEYLPGVDCPDPAVCAPVADGAIGVVGTSPAVWLLGAHGGAGVSCLESMVSFAADSGRLWPGGYGQSPLVVIVARGSVDGLEAANALCRQYVCGMAGAAHLLGVAVVAGSAGKPSKAIQRSRGAVDPFAGYDWHVWEVPWIEELLDVPKSQLPCWWPGDPVAKKRNRAQLAAGEIPAGVSVFAQQVLECVEHYVHSDMSVIQDKEYLS